MFSKSSSHKPSAVLRHFPKNALPIIAILRGIPHKDVTAVAETLIEAGITLIEVTLNTEAALASIELIAKEYSNQATIGAGTVLSSDSVKNVHRAGGTFIVSPNTHPEVIKQTKNLKMVSIPGAFTPTEIMTALNYQADLVKIFPASLMKPQGIRTLKSILPPHVRLVATGSIIIPDYNTHATTSTHSTHSTTPTSHASSPSIPPNHPNEETIYGYLQAGCWGIGLGNTLYNPTLTLDQLKENAKHAVAAVRTQLSAANYKRHPNWD
ncbi:2-dehydro-3-deoxy-6-phosphogalactonate aldolase [Spirochaetota bacterium]|nr:2-dehydro-3-deoxy-6-phosphogalactonate aldolase [Spirochaetota bacterium]